MGVSIQGYNLGEYLGEKLYNETNNDSAYIFSHKFGNINHLTEFKTGYYLYDNLNVKSLNMSYGWYNGFRRRICLLVNKVEPNEIWSNPEKWDKKPFVEFINFSDCEGCFDFKIAEKLYNDFKDHEVLIKSELIDDYDDYCRYMDILKTVYENKGVVYYT